MTKTNNRRARPFAWAVGLGKQPHLHAIVFWTKKDAAAAARVLRELTGASFRVFALTLEKKK